MAASVTVRMYNQLNLGDCFLLKFEDKSKKSFLLIDCGSYEKGNEEREIEIANSIKDTVKDNPLIVVLTHQHKDHLSGFISAADVFKSLNIAGVWLSYLDDPTGSEAIAMRKVTEKFWKKNAENKKKAKKKFAGVALVEKMLNAKEGFDLFAEEQTGGAAITNLLEWSNNQKQFLLPGENFDLPRLPEGAVRVYVLGPPTGAADLKKLNPGKGEAVESLASMMELMNTDTAANLVGNALDALADGPDSTRIEDDFPFGKKFTIPVNDKKRSPVTADEYLVKDQWRRIDHDWLSEMGRMSLHMDTLTNNSSLVLAFELGKSGKVLMFVGDAQIGNWRSWFNVTFKDSNVNATDLLSRTVFYKAGHHSSHNATLLSGLDIMNEKDLVIMIPVNEKISTNRGFAMLREGMLKGYNRKSKGRVLRSDTIFHMAPKPNSFLFPFAKTENDFSPRVKVTNDASGHNHLFIEYTVK